MSSKFLKQKALPNILVNLLEVPIEKAEESNLIQHMRSAIESTYGNDRYTVYVISEQELLIDSKTASASVLVIVSGKSSNRKLSVSAPQVELEYQTLCSGNNFNSNYFLQSVQPFLTIDAGTKSAADFDDKETRLFIFDSSRSFQDWKQLTRKQSFQQFTGSFFEIKSDSALVIDWRQHCTGFDLKYFNAKDYFDNLNTNYCGRLVAFTNITTTTMDLSKQFQNVNGMVVYTNYQTKAIGRTNNQWLSPFGSASFTINLNFPMYSPIMKHISFIQNLVSLAVVLAMPRKELNIRIKWPNDILYAESMSKLAGILVKSFCYDKNIYIQIGIGINVSNSRPSVCLDDIIAHYNSQQPEESKVDPVSKEALVARIVTQFELLLDMFIKNEKLPEIKELYFQNWIHSDEIFTVRSSSGQNQRKARVTGIDDNGFLQVTDTETGEVLFIQPDGNRFDLMHNMLIVK